MEKEVEILGEENKKEKRKISSIFVLLFFIVALGCSGYLIYNILLLSGIENTIRYIVIGILAFIDLLLFIKTKNIWKNKQPKKKKNKKKPSKRIGFILFLIIYSGICFGLGYVINYVYGQLDSVNKKEVTYTSSLIVLSDNKANSITDIKDYKIAMLKDTTSPEGYIIPQTIIKENKLHDTNNVVEYTSYTEMIADLYTGDLDAIFLSSEYSTIYSSIPGYENIGTETKKIISKSKKMLKTETSKAETESTGKSVTEPFTILLMGIDSTDDVLTKNAVANGDSLILITFNPKTLNATMLSIPRDSYVPIACWPGKKENKITHAAAYGTDCMINTIENFFDVNIDYYAKINFKGLVNLVNAMGGIDVEVPQDLCTDNSNREEIVCINKGWQHLDGEGALVLSRNRKQLVNGDFGRGQNQQLVIQAMLQKVKTINSVSQFTEIFNTISNSLDTNLTTKQILSFYSVAKDIMKTGLSSEKSNLITIDQLYLQGQSAMIYDYGMRMELYNYIPNTYSQKDITKAMKTNLELLNHDDSKSFSFSINKTYEKKVVGYGPYKSTFNASKYPKAPEETPEETKEEKEEITGCMDKSYKEYNPKATKSDKTKCKTKLEDEDEDEDDPSSEDGNNKPSEDPSSGSGSDNTQTDNGGSTDSGDTGNTGSDSGDQTEGGSTTDGNTTPSSEPTE